MTVILAFSMGLTSNNGVWAQQFRLVAPQANAVSNALLSDRDLTVTDARGQSTVYLRDPQFDSGDGQWLGYYSRNAGQVIRWPLASIGNMQIGEIAGGTVRYRTSQMVIEPVNRVVNRPILPPPMPGDPLAGITPSSMFRALQQDQRSQSQMLQLVSFDRGGRQLYLTHQGFTSVSLTPDALGDSHWWVVPAGNRAVRVQHYENGRLTALTGVNGRQIALSALAQDSRQLWYINSLAASGNQFVLESAAYNGLCLTAAGPQLVLQPIVWSPDQFWTPLSAPSLPTFEPFWRTVNQEIHANSPLPPAQLGLANSHRSALFVLLADLRQSGKTQQIRIEPGQTASLTLDRDAGATLVETYEIRSAGGLWDRQQFTTAIPPRPLYDLSVYEEFLQSIAIDRTGKSPKPIEDVNYVPKSVGWLQVPAGTQLPQSSTMDIMRQAKAANNPGAVRRMDMKQFDDPAPANPLETILDEFKSTPRKRF